MPNSEYNQDRYSYERSPRQSQRRHEEHSNHELGHPRDRDRDHADGKRAQFTRSLSNTEVPSDEKAGKDIILSRSFFSIYKTYKLYTLRVCHLQELPDFVFV